MTKSLCIHGHFYQPPRENAWLEEIEIQDSAYPYHDWNERITAESYSPNSAARILSGDNRIIDIVNNYSRISFNFGPTLLSWMEKKEPDVYEAILEADRLSQERFSGHGSALAQVFNHMIMPLANTRDKQTQVYWGIQDFEFRFGRSPEGMWLPETAVDTETLEVLAEYGIAFTILSPYQANRIRKLDSEESEEPEQKSASQNRSAKNEKAEQERDNGESEENEGWRDVSGGKIDPKRPYLCRLPSGNTITLFFYDGPISQEVGFGNLLRNGERFANRLRGAFTDQKEENQLVHIATDGETYGHHYEHGDMALAYCLYHIDTNDLADITIYGEYLEKNPPEYEVEILEESSWSCVHGIERWRSDCGCKTGMHEDWTQEWRKPLRESLDWLRGELIEIYEQETEDVFSDPWKVRDEYIRVILDRDKGNVLEFLNEQVQSETGDPDYSRLLHLLELQRHAMLMYTSCGWFFDEISGIETTQVIQYADRAIQLAQEITGKVLEDEFAERLAEAPSNLPNIENGEGVYRDFVKPARLDMLRVGAHYAVLSVFEEFPETKNIYCYTTVNEAFEHKVSGKIRLSIGRVRVTSNITWHEGLMSFAVIYLGEHILNGGVRMFISEQAYESMCQMILEAFMRSDISDVFNLLDDQFGTHNYTLWHLFKDEQRTVFDQILESSLERIEFSFRQIYEDEYPLMQAMRELDLPMPSALTTTLEFILNMDIRKLLESEEPDLDRLQELIDELQKWPVELDTKTIPFVASRQVVAALRKLAEAPEDVQLLQDIHALVRKLQELPMNLDLWEAQNLYFDIGKQLYRQKSTKAEQGDDAATAWLDNFSRLGDDLRVGFE